MQPFKNAAAVSGYAELTPRKVPGFADMQRMAMLLLSEQAPANAEILVLGAGGGLELKAFAEAQPDWRLVGVDPAAAMLALAARATAPFGERVHLREGYIQDAPEGPFNGATCLLTMHFMGRAERLRTLRELHRRLKPGAPLVVAHHTAPAVGERERWLLRSTLFSMDTPADPVRAAASASALAEALPLLTEAEEVAVLQEAGFHDVGLFYAAFSFRGWVAYA
ncbi:class I SAM-dependent methyltransferase [Stenotrophomonas sp. AB1(2024)]|uniref:class I SAM-dependent methyltransferase n=1 Tax=Stenotrophomonas sp. AB1(2024) TaxID=3132215 RepID=UPI0038F9E69E